MSKDTVITEEIIEHAKYYVKHKSHISEYPGGLESEKQVLTKILGFLEGKFNNMQLDSDLVDKPATLNQAVDEADDEQLQSPEPKSADGC
ncbi:hypothetical protein EJB10_02810 [Wolbachia endosymbiont of Brugia malayi]|uniref:hypothetical protein n=1 Tax=Wolbachia endosymbiont of Brugia malayi TaxID=80849 RepID=UPI00004C9297|nr:hypothetical protein [Wolbachia endosymbiont of Brugia malayi]AAW70726.1 Predicted protein [Wolbachia endosymbiont strain TRS of Brugia malayi]QCB61703.1 hypothetical protein EJB10_02810 [Wolbachia endosymbiont of Brugia malayi]